MESPSGVEPTSAAVAPALHTPVNYTPVSNFDAQFALAPLEDGVEITPRAAEPLPRRVSPLGCFTVDRPQGTYPQLTMHMGAVFFRALETATVAYRPPNHAADRTLDEVYLLESGGVDADPQVLSEVATRWLASQTHDEHSWARRAPQGADLERRTAELQSIHFGPGGWFNVLEMHALDSLVGEAARDGLHVVEIGSFQGRSTSVIATALTRCAADSLVISIDPYTCGEAQAEITAAHLTAVGERRRLVQIQRRSQDVPTLLAGGTACLAFIDGSHAREDVAADFELCDRLLVPGGIMVFHDVFALDHLGPLRKDPPFTGPAEVIEEVVIPSDRYTPLLHVHLTMAFRKRA
jgi:predicted O-methyltransferase YrrM